MKNSIPKDCHCSPCGYTGLLLLRAAASQCGPCQLRKTGAVLVAHILDKLLSERWTWLCTALIQLTYCNTLPINTVTKKENQIKLWQNVTTPVYYGKLILKMNRSTLFTCTCFCLCLCMCDTYMTGGASKIRGRYPGTTVMHGCKLPCHSDAEDWTRILCKALLNHWAILPDPILWRFKASL